MPDRKEVISHLQIMHTWAEFALEKGVELFDAKHLESIVEWTEEALDLLKQFEPHVITEEDFKSADQYGYLPSWCEERGGDLYPECIVAAAITYKDYRYWTGKPTEEQRKAVRWDD